MKSELGYIILDESEKGRVQASQTKFSRAEYAHMGGGTSFSYTCFDLIEAELKAITKLKREGKTAGCLASLLGLTRAMEDVDGWYSDTDVPEESEAAVRKLGNAWRGLLQLTDAQLGVKNGEMGRAALEQFLERLAKEWETNSDEMSFEPPLRLKWKPAKPRAPKPPGTGALKRPLDGGESGATDDAPERERDCKRSRTDPPQLWMTLDAELAAMDVNERGKRTFQLRATQEDGEHRVIVVSGTINLYGLEKALGCAFGVLDGEILFLFF